MRTSKPPRLSIEHFGPLRCIDVAFGDLTVIVGPQATGKSIFLETLKLVIDRDAIHAMFARHGMAFNGSEEAFLDA